MRTQWRHCTKMCIHLQMHNGFLKKSAVHGKIWTRDIGHYDIFFLTWLVNIRYATTITLLYLNVTSIDYVSIICEIKQMLYAMVMWYGTTWSRGWLTLLAAVVFTGACLFYYIWIIKRYLRDGTSSKTSLSRRFPNHTIIKFNALLRISAHGFSFNCLRLFSCTA